jgi:hypothetical protein
VADDLKLEEAGKTNDVVADDGSEGEGPSTDPLHDNPDLQKELYDLYLKNCGEDRYARLVEVKDVKQAEFYWGGRQYVWWSSQDKSWQLPSQAQAVNYGDLNLDDMPRFEFVTNIYQSRGLMVIGAVASSPPRIRFFPTDADEEEDLETADGRTKLAKIIQRWNPVQKQLQDEVYHAYTGGTICYWTHYVGDEEKYGLDSLPLMVEGKESLDAEIICPQCGWRAPADYAEPPMPCPECQNELTEDDISQKEEMPMPEDGGTVTVPKGRQLIDVYGALNIKRPQHVQNQSQFHYFAIEEEIHYSILRSAFPDKADEIKPGMSFGADDVFERNARLSIAENTKLLTQTGSAQASLCTFARVWFRKAAFYQIDDKAKRQELLDIFPRGCRVEFCGRTYCQSEAQSMDDCVVVVHAMPGRGQHRNGIGTSEMSVQDRANTLSNISQETYEYGIPITYRASDTWASDADEDQRAAPGLEVEVALRDGQNIQQRIMQVRADSVSPDMQKHMMDLIGPVSDDMTGTYPAVSGAGAEQGAPDTLGQQGMQRDQAMGRMGIFYVNLRQAHADILTLACRDLQAHVDGTLKLPILGKSGEFESESVDMAALDGDAEAYPEGDETYPELWRDQKATMMQVAATPYGLALVQDPENAELMVKLIGIQDLKVPGADGRRKQLKEIAEITKAMSNLEESPMGGAPMVEVDPDTDDNPVEAATCKWFLNTVKGQKLKKENPLAWMAIKEHMQQHLKAMPPPPPPQKPGTISITTPMDKMPPAAQAQWLEKEYGIKLDVNSFEQQVVLEHAKKNGLPTPGAALPAAAPQGVPANQPAGGQ